MRPIALIIAQWQPPALSPSAFIAVVVLAAIGLGAGLFYGVSHWKQPIGKVVSIVAGLLLIVLVLWVSFVSLVAWSAHQGHPF